MESIPLLWQRIERWLAAHAPHLLSRLNSGASEVALAQAEATLGITLPEDFKASYRLHNGGASLFVGMGESFFSLERMLGEWSVYQDLKEQESDWAETEPGFLTDLGREHPPIQPVWWHPNLIPFAADGAGNNWCVDLDPTLGGHVGQVIDWDHEDGPSRVLFPSFQALLCQLADDLEAGKYLGFENHLEWRLTEGKEARDQARRYDEQQPSPGKELIDKALHLGWTRGTEEEPIPFYLQVLQMEQARAVNRFRAYHNLIIMYRKLHRRDMEDRSYGRVLNQASTQQTEENYREVAERLLAAFEAEAKQMPAGHWVYDDLAQAQRDVFPTRGSLRATRDAVATGNVAGAVSILGLILWAEKEWLKAEERFEIYALLLYLLLQQQLVEQAREVFAQFRAEAQQRLPEDPVQETVRSWAARLQQASAEQTE
ncbi:MAG: SMI1/KNR4 family protein [Chloroflexota bacterium]|nr:SMI1/KNR4 family protein [Chloroflexota bacterium]